MDLTAALRAFVRTVERGSITRAAKDLGVSQPAVTKHLINLERHVNARLLDRSTRAVRPTPHGLTLYEASRTALASIEAALEGVRRDMGTIEGALRIYAPSCIGAQHLHGVAMAFQDVHPGVTIDLILDNRDADLVYENFDLAIRYGRPEGNELIARRIGSMERILVAAPSFLERVGPVDTLERLSEVSVVTTAQALSPRDMLALVRDGVAVEAPIRPSLRTNNSQVLVRSLADGRGAGPVQVILVSDELASGRLVRILPDYHVRPTDAFLTYPSARFMRPAVRAFTDFTVPRLRGLTGVTA